MSPAHASTSVDAWLESFATEKQAACRAYLCSHYDLNTLDAEALINAALLQVALHWATIEAPFAYFWQTLKHAVYKQKQRRTFERRQLVEYAQQYQIDAHGAVRTAQHIEDVLEQVSPGQRCLLEWFMQDYDDAQITARLKTTPQAVRVKRHRLIHTLRVRLCPRRVDTATPATQGGK